MSRLYFMDLRNVYVKGGLDGRPFGSYHYYFIILIPLVGAILLIVWFATEGDPGDNEYGPPPL